MKLTQCQRIMRHLQEIGPIDDLTAYSEYGIRRLAARIHDLKGQGYDIDMAGTQSGDQTVTSASLFLITPVATRMGW